jgi:hypothetical protein
VTEQRSATAKDKILIHVDPDIADLIPGFLNNRRKDLHLLTNALSQADFHTIRTVGHRMRGDGGGYGFHGISIIGQALEQGAMEKDAQEIQRSLVELTHYLEQVEVVID